MSDYIDLLTPSQDALFDALKPLVGADAMPSGWRWFQHVPQDTEPPFSLIGQLTSENQSDTPGEQLELVKAEVIHVWRGNSRRGLMQMMAVTRNAIHNKPISAPGVQLGEPDYVTAEVGEAIKDGVTYVGMQIFKFYAQPV